jgi:UDP-4-amino-4,6-dideoxy-N-acetyl-beta-L-altrosamine transaminase
MKSMNIPYGRQSINTQDLRAILSTVRSEYLTQGPEVEKFESALGFSFGAAHSIAVNSATSALHLACMALGVDEGDLVWTSAVTFVASANCAMYCGADVDFVEIDSETYNMSTEALETKLRKASRAGRLPKVVIPVHLTGQPCDMKAIHELSKKYGFSIIEDASHATGASYRGSPIGSCEFSDITVFSFHPVKIITTGEGGAALTNSPKLADKMRRLRSHGITRNSDEFTVPSPPSFYYEQHDLGFNYRMTDVQAALGTSQLKRLDPFIKRRRQIASYYDEKFRDHDMVLPFQHPDGKSSWHLYVVRVLSRAGKSSRDQIFEGLRQRGIGVNLHYMPVYRHPFYAKMGFNPESFPNSEAYYAEAISLPIFPELKSREQDQVISSLLELTSKSL